MEQTVPARTLPRLRPQDKYCALDPNTGVQAPRGQWRFADMPSIVASWQGLYNQTFVVPRKFLQPYPPACNLHVGMCSISSLWYCPMVLSVLLLDSPFISAQPTTPLSTIISHDSGTGG